MAISFSKYHGAGNDFILIDDRKEHFPLINTAHIQRLCHRHYGIGADGLILLQLSQVADARMRIFNADGSEAEMCGNGIRCLFHFAQTLGVIQKEAQIETAASILTCRADHDQIAVLHPTPRLILHDLMIEGRSLDLVDSGVPHAVIFTDDIHSEQVYDIGKRVRFHAQFSPGGTNVTFVQPLMQENLLLIRTYERGVENETQACGTAAVAAAFLALQKLPLSSPLRVVTASKTIFETTLNKKGVELKGPAVLSFTGNLILQGGTR